MRAARALAAACLLAGTAGSGATAMPQSSGRNADAIHHALGSLAALRTFRVLGQAAGAEAGTSVAAAGDVNGDGYDDVLIGAPGFDPGGQPRSGRVYLHLGGFGGPRREPAWTVTGAAGEELGRGLASAGDVNGDGFADVVVGSPRTPDLAGRVSVYHGSPGGLSTAPQWTMAGPGTGARFGGAVASAGDVNGDGFDDLLVGASGASQGEESEGLAFLYLGSAAGLAAGPAWTAQSDTRLAYFGAALGTAGDVNADGFADVVVGAPNWAIWTGPVTFVSYGRMYVYHGSAAGLSPTPARVITPTEQESDFGVSVGTAGDVNGDGYDDVIVGAFEWGHVTVEQGAAFVYAGSPSGIPSQPAWAQYGEGPGVQLYFGWRVGAAGDVNGDGYGDVVVGMMGYPGYPPQPGVSGRVLVYEGSSAGLSTSAAWTLTGQCDDCLFGWAAAGAGDVDGDGCDDVAAGAPFWNAAAGADAGMARVIMRRSCRR